MKPTITLDNAALLVLNNCMAPLDAMTLESVAKPQRTAISICCDLRTELLQKAVKTRQKDKSFKMKLAYHKAEALWNWLTHFEIYFPDSFGTFERNKLMILRNDLHQQL